MRFSLAILLIKATMSPVNGGLPRLFGLDLRLHTQWNRSSFIVMAMLPHGKLCAIMSPAVLA